MQRRGDANLDVVIRGKDATRRAFGRVRGRVTSLTNSIFSLKSVGIGLAGVFAGRVARSFADAFGKQEESILSLNQALRNTGQFSEEASERIQASAAEIQALTKAGDEAIIQGTASLAQLATQLDPDQLIAAQRAVVGIADTFLKGDIEGAALLVGKSIGSSTNALTRYGIQLDTAATQEEKLQQLLEQSAGFFATSQARTQGLAGTLAQASNAAGDVQETIGELALEIIQLDGANNGIVETIQGFDQRLKENRGSIVFWGRTSIATLKLIGGSLLDLVKIFFNGGRAIGSHMIAQFAAAKAKIILFLNDAIGQVNSFLDKVERIPGVELNFRIGRLDAQEATLSAVAAQGRFQGAVLDSMDAVNRLGRRFDETAVAIARAREELANFDSTAGQGSATTTGAAVADVDLGITPTVVSTSGQRIREIAPPELVEDDGRELTDPLENAATAVESLRDSFKDLGKSAGSVLQDLINSEEGLGKAIVSTLKEMSAGKALFYLAEAAAALASGFLGNPGGFKAAAGYAEAAALHGGIAAVTGAFSGPSNGGGSLGSSVGADASASRIESRGRAEVLVEGGVINVNDPQQAEDLTRAVNDLYSRGYLDIVIKAAG